MNTSNNKVIFFALILSSAYISFNFNYLDVGDLLGYEMDFNRTCKENMQIRWDFGYVAYQCIASTIMNFKLFLTLNTVICIYIKFSKAKHRNINTLVYLIIFFTTFELHQLKAAMSSSIILFAYITFNENRNTFYKLLAASSFHLSAILIPIFLIIKKNVFYIIIIILWVALLADYILPRVNAYIDTEPYISVGRIIFIILSLLLIDMKNLQNRIFILYPSILYLVMTPIIGVIPHRFYYLIYPVVIYNLISILIEDTSYLKKILAGSLISAAIFNSLN